MSPVVRRRQYPNVVTKLFFAIQRASLSTGLSTRLFFGARDKLIPFRRRRITELLSRFDVTYGDTCIDCGANVGNVAAVLCGRGANVICFEPDEYVFPILQRRFGGSLRSRVTCYQKGVWNEDAVMTLYRDPRCGEDPARFGVSSSVLDGKSNVSKTLCSQIEVVDLAKFINHLSTRVKLLKLDIEGAELTVIPHLITLGALAHVENLVVETHEATLPQRAADFVRLRTQISHDTNLKDKIHLDWI
jgi:FkbM family methyltransferase